MAFHTDMSKKVVAFVARDAKNRPFVKVCYDFGEGLHDAFSLSPSEASQASYIYRKSHTSNDRDRGIVKLNPETGAIYSEQDHNPLYTPAFITGSEPGVEDVQKTIDSLRAGCSNLDVMIPLYVSSGKQTIFYNEESLEDHERDGSTMTHEERVETDKREYEKHKIFKSILDGKSTPDHDDFEI